MTSVESKRRSSHVPRDIWLARVRRRGRYETFDDERSNLEPFMWRTVPENPERQAFRGELRGLLESAIDTRCPTACVRCSFFAKSKD